MLICVDGTGHPKCETCFHFIRFTQTIQGLRYRYIIITLITIGSSRVAYTARVRHRSLIMVFPSFFRRYARKRGYALCLHMYEEKSKEEEID